MLISLVIVALTTFLLNLPCGFWRQGTRRFSPSWILAVHLPVPLVVLLRLHFGLGFAWYTYPVVAGAYFIGQYLGGQWRKSRYNAPGTPLHKDQP
ncbi:MAG: hypothetical protein KOO60_04615 [Gemmatimonadales bacterium]|nr:hypothetical protein [Gemmatimonadales bacterium]